MRLSTCDFREIAKFFGKRMALIKTQNLIWHPFSYFLNSGFKSTTLECIFKELTLIFVSKVSFSEPQPNAFKRMRKQDVSTRL